MKERPIIFSGPMVRAIIEGRKTQTRRVVKPQPGKFTHVDYNDDLGWHLWWDVSVSGIADGDVEQQYFPLRCPYGVPGDRLWCKETAYIAPINFGDADLCNATDTDGNRRVVGYVASMDHDAMRCAEEYGVKKTPSIHMPRWASRITLEIESVRVERLQEISEADARAEGITETFDSPGGCHERTTAAEHFRYLWESIHGTGEWTLNPWVWVLSFKKV